MTPVLEITGGIIRIFSEGRSYGDPYEFAFVIIGDGDTAILKALRSDDFHLDKETVDKIRILLLQMGFHKVRWHRMKEGGKIERIFEREVIAE